MNEQPPPPPVAAGDRVRVTGILDNPAPLTAGMEGTVYWVGTWTIELTRQIGVRPGPGISSSRIARRAR